MTPMEFILRFTFSNPDLDTTIVGTAKIRAEMRMQQQEVYTREATAVGADYSGQR
jgi:hypothetical protein